MLLVGNLLRYMCAKNYPNIAWFDKVIAKNKTVQFLTHMAQLTMPSRYVDVERI